MTTFFYVWSIYLPVPAARLSIYLSIYDDILLGLEHLPVPAARLSIYLSIYL